MVKFCGTVDPLETSLFRKKTGLSRFETSLFRSPNNLVSFSNQGTIFRKQAWFKGYSRAGMYIVDIVAIIIMFSCRKLRKSGGESQSPPD
ncbi:MAG: hypothetical protein WC142_07620 [Bacteroidales bacterium]|nr:hypothetical protein [Bacteroidales bacterium]MDD2687446.1 hypothetical protein [Bacteroidales bacterium]MDD3331275.1 hypothetical protein [Bacteroidales bacterium]MDD3692252.1 hypothetical protein [Bacteroidales bacterium]MDD4582130.1 hypothetical protein [Bacteroidales bacterium]